MGGIKKETSNFLLLFLLSENSPLHLLQPFVLRAFAFHSFSLGCTFIFLDAFQCCAKPRPRGLRSRPRGKRLPPPGMLLRPRVGRWCR